MKGVLVLRLILSSTVIHKSAIVRLCARVCYLTVAARAQLTAACWLNISPESRIGQTTSDKKKGNICVMVMVNTTSNNPLAQISNALPSCQLPGLLLMLANVLQMMS